VSGPVRDLDACVDFLRRLIRTPGPPGQEGATAALVESEMRRLGYRDVRVDRMGNVLGRVPGTGEVPPTMFNTHLDHVDAGDEGGWTHPPFAAEVADGKVWGRGAVDIKGPMAAQVHGVARLLSGPPPPGDVWVTAVVQEEIGGVGARFLRETLAVPLAVIGEPSSNTLRRGHRGRTELVLHIVGRSVHASVPERAVHPLETLARFVLGLEVLVFPVDPVLGPSSVALTLLETDQTSPNVTPGKIRQVLDWRSIPGESGEDARQALLPILEAALGEGASATIDIPVYAQTTYTGERMDIPGSNPAYALSDDHPAVVAGLEIVGEVTGVPQQPGVWKFATDGGHFAEAGIAPIGIGPGDELLAHTNREHVEIAELEAALAINEALARELGRRVARLPPAPLSSRPQRP
jgi:putative selenium metabolism hydrolase